MCTNISWHLVGISQHPCVQACVSFFRSVYLSRTIQLSSGVPFVRGKTLEGAVGALLPLSKDLMKPKAALPKTDTVVSAFLQIGRAHV